MNRDEFEMTIVLMDGKQIHAAGTMEEMLQLIKEEKHRGIKRIRMGRMGKGEN